MCIAFITEFEILSFPKIIKQEELQIKSYLSTAKNDWQSYYNSLVFEIAREINTTDEETILKFIYNSQKVKGILDNCEAHAKQIVEINNDVIVSAKEILAEIDK